MKSDGAQQQHDAACAAAGLGRSDVHSQWISSSSDEQRRREAGKQLALRLVKRLQASRI